MVGSTRTVVGVATSSEVGVVATVQVGAGAMTQRKGRGGAADGKGGGTRRRGSRTLYLLICIVLGFVISWLPLNTLNLLLDLGYKETLFG